MSALLGGLTPRQLARPLVATECAGACCLGLLGNRPRRSGLGLPGGLVGWAVVGWAQLQGRRLRLPQFKDEGCARGHGLALDGVRRLTKKKKKYPDDLT